MVLFLYVGILFYFYLTTTVAAKIGVVQVSTFSLFLPAFYTIYCLSKINFYKLYFCYKIENIILLLAIFFSIFKLLFGDIQDIKNIILLMVVPLLFYIIISFQNSETKKTIKIIIIFFYITECVLAIYERINGVIVFPYENGLEYSMFDGFGFRSGAFLGHPLSNALCVSTIMGFIFVSDLKFNQKFFLVMIGYVAILSFNARGAIVVWTFLMPFYIFRNGVKQSIGFKQKTFLVSLFIVAVFFIYLIVSKGFGDRFFQGVLLDGSALTRINVWGSFKHISSVDFLLGNSKNYLYVMNKLGSAGVENSFIVIVIKYGILLGSILFFVFFVWVRRILLGLKLSDKLLIITSFVLVGSMNNSLSSPESWSIFAICSGAFLSRIELRS